MVEDDYDSEFDAHPLPALQSLDRDERVIYVGTLSKTLAPGLRLGYVVAPRHIAPAFRFARTVTSLGASAHLQKTVADFLSQGFFSRHVRRMTGIYERRRRILVETLAKKLPPGFTIGPAQTGLHVAIVGPADFDDVRADNNLSEGNRVLPLSLLCVERKDCKGFLVGFSAGSGESIGARRRCLPTRSRPAHSRPAPSATSRAAAMSSQARPTDLKIVVDDRTAARAPSKISPASA